MTPGATREYAGAVRGRYLCASRQEKAKILDEFTRVTGCHRKAAIRMIRRGNPAGTKRVSERKQGRPRRYGNEVVTALKLVWEATDRLCSKRLQPFMGEMVGVLRRHGEESLTLGVEAQLCQMSASTIDRLLRPYKRSGGRRPFSTTRPGSLLKRSIPIRTFADWEEERPGFFEADLVAHCGESAEGFFLNTLCMVDVATNWTECIGVWGKGQQRVGAAVHRIRQRLPFPMLGLDSDNGSEFINQYLLEYCRREKITFTRSRPYKKNDSCHVEQKNWLAVRRLIGHDRYATHKALETLDRIYYLTRHYINFFQPVRKLVYKTRHGARVHKLYDVAQTPYQRLLESGVLTEAQKDRLAATYHLVNPTQLLDQVNGNLEYLWKQAVRPQPGTRPQEVK